MRRRMQLGFSILESVVAGFLMVFLVGTVMMVTRHSATVAQQVDDETSETGRNRIGFDRLCEDVQIATAILARYPSTGSASYTSNSSSTLILRLPTFDGDGNAIEDQSTVVIYQLVAADGLSKIQRLIARTSPGNEPEPVLDRNLLSNVTSWNLSYVANETFIGNEGQTVFGLRAVPTGATKDVKQTIMLAGKDWNGTSYANFDGANVEFTRPPRWGVPIDVTYVVSPSTPVDSAMSNAANLVTLSLSMDRKTVSQGKSYGNASTDYRLSIGIRNR